jgi:hypothetical protein
MTLVRSLRTQRQQVGLLELIGSNWLVSEGCLGVSFGKLKSEELELDLAGF